MIDLEEEQNLVQDNQNHTTIFTDFKDWLMNETTQFVHGEN